MTRQLENEKLAELKAIRARRIELQERAEQILRDLRPLNEKICSTGLPLQPHRLPQPAAPKPPISEKVAQLIGNVVALPAPEAPSAPRLSAGDELVVQSRALSDELAAVNEAIEALRGPEHDAMLDASEVECRRRAAEYGAIVDRIVKGVRDVAEALIQYDEFTRSFVASGLSWSFLKPLPVSLIGDDWTYRFSELARAANRQGRGSIDPAMIRKWSRHEVHRIEPQTRATRPQSSAVRVGSVSTYRLDATAAKATAAPPLKVAAKDVRVNTTILRRK